MELREPQSLLRSLGVVTRSFARAFPTPALLAPRAAGVDISDASIKWLAFEPDHSGFRVATYGEEPLQDGVVVNGTIKDVAALGDALREVRKHLGGIRFAHAALPEEAAYVFETHVPETNDHEQVRRLIEFEFEARVPITTDAAVFDFDIIQEHDIGGDIAVSVFPRELAESYVAAFDRAGIGLLSLELEARSIARAISSPGHEDPITLLVDFGRARTGFAVLKRGIPIFTSTVEVGGDSITRTLVEKMNLSNEEAVAFRNEQGLAPDEKTGKQGLDAVAGVASALSDEIARHYHYWDTRRNDRGERMTPVGRVVLVGGSANLRGLADYVAGRVQAPALVGDVWGRICRFDSYVPPIDKRASLQYATAIGLALRAHRI